MNANVAVVSARCKKLACVIEKKGYFKTVVTLITLSEYVSDVFTARSFLIKPSITI